MGSLIAEFGFPAQTIGHLISSVQLGFISGTLVFAFLAIADRLSPSLVFFMSAILGSLSNLALIVVAGDLTLMYGSRFLTGFFLAGIYPVGMKIAADHFDKDLGKALGYLLGALVLGTAFPHLLKSMLNDFPWEHTVTAVSVLAIMGGLVILFFVPDGPYRRKNTQFRGFHLLKIFRIRDLRAAAFGYFGHMWELYTFWTFVPVIVAAFLYPEMAIPSEISLLTFLIIGVGSVGCVIGGYVSRITGSYHVALLALSLSFMCCLVSPLVFTLNPAFIFVFLLFWGMVVIMDSPQFSSLVAQTAPAEEKASALTIVNCIGFSITILSIQLINFLSGHIHIQWLFVFLLPGPALGLYAMLFWRGEGNLQKTIP